MHGQAEWPHHCPESTSGSDLPTGTKLHTLALALMGRGGHGQAVGKGTQGPRGNGDSSWQALYLQMRSLLEGGTGKMLADMQVFVTGTGKAEVLTWQ